MSTTPDKKTTSIISSTWLLNIKHCLIKLIINTIGYDRAIFYKQWFEHHQQALFRAVKSTYCLLHYQEVAVKTNDKNWDKYNEKLLAAYGASRKQIVTNTNNVSRYQIWDAEQFLLFLKNDIILTPSALNNAIHALQDEPRSRAIVAKVITTNGILYAAGGVVVHNAVVRPYGQGDNPEAPPYQYRRVVLRDHGGFLLITLAAYQAIIVAEPICLVSKDSDNIDSIDEIDNIYKLLNEHGFEVLYEPRVCVIKHSYINNILSKIYKYYNAINQYITSNTSNFTYDSYWLPATASNKQHILYIDDRVPHCQYGAGFPRANFILHCLAEQYAVTMVPLNMPNEETWEQVYTDIPKRVEVMKDLGRIGFKQFLQARKDYFAVILVSRPQNMQFYITIHNQIYGTPQRGPKIIYDAEAVFALRDQARNTILDGLCKQSIYELKQEIALTNKARHVFVVSAQEQQLFLAQGVKAVTVVGHALKLAPTVTAFGHRKNILFIGNMDGDYGPNVDSVCWFTEQVLPQICAQIPTVQLLLVGANASSRIRNINHPAVQLLGRVQDLTAYYENCRLLVAPTRFAAGLPYKVHEAAARGLPVVCSSLIQQQLGWDNNAILAADHTDPDGFARQCLRLYSDSVCWQGVRDVALKHVEQECAESTIRAQLLQVFEQVLAV